MRVLHIAFALSFLFPLFSLFLFLFLFIFVFFPSAGAVWRWARLPNFRSLSLFNERVACYLVAALPLHRAHKHRAAARLRVYRSRMADAWLTNALWPAGTLPIHHLLHLFLFFSSFHQKSLLLISLPPITIPEKPFDETHASDDPVKDTNQSQQKNSIDLMRRPK